MKFSSIIWILFFSLSTQAQVNLDKPVMVGMGDQVYEAANDPGWYYFFPLELCRSSRPEVSLQGLRLFADFSVSLCQVQIEHVKAALVAQGIKNPQVRVFKGINATTTAMSLRDAYPSYDPKIEGLGDAGNFSEKVPYRLSLYAGSKKRSVRNAQNVMGTLFGVQSVDAFVQVQFTFSSVFGGQVRECSSAVSVYIGRDPIKSSRASGFDLISTETFRQNPVQVREDSVSRCWENPTPGVICLK